MYVVELHTSAKRATEIIVTITIIALLTRKLLTISIQTEIVVIKSKSIPKMNVFLWKSSAWEITLYISFFKVLNSQELLFRIILLHTLVSIIFFFFVTLLRAMCLETEEFSSVMIVIVEDVIRKFDWLTSISEKDNWLSL